MTRVTIVHAFALVIALLLHASFTYAQVAVLRIDPEAEPVCRDVEAALQGVGVVADPGYIKESRDQGLDPTSDSTLELITPLLQIKLAVIPLAVDDAGIEIEYRDGRNGARLGTVTIAQENGVLGPRGRAQLRRDVVNHLGTVLGDAPSSAGSPETPGYESGVPASEAESEREPDAPASLNVFIRAGLGLGTRDVEWTRDGRIERVELGAFPAFDLGLAFVFPLSDSIALAPSVAYQSSLAFHEVEEARMAAPPDKVGVRAHRFAAVLALPILLGGEGSASIAPAVGLGIRNLRPEVHHLSTPAYSLAGPLVQLAIRIPFSDTVALRITPEAQLLFVGEGLRERDVESSGIGVGGELALSINLVDPVALEINYREAHALLSSLDGDAGDVERFITLRAVAEL